MALIHGKKIKIFALNSNIELAQEIADHIGIPLSKCTVNRFSDGEVQVNIDETVRGHIVFVVQSTNCPVNEHYMELLIMVDALKRASAEEINIIMPYYGYSRQDRKAAPRQPISAKLMADLLQTAGATRLMCLDLHADQIQGFFNIPIDNFLALPILAEYFIKKELDDVVVVAPDHGGTTRARKLAVVLDAPMAIVDKRRPRPNVAEVMNVIGDIEGKNCVIIDDMIDTAGTICEASKLLMREGAKEVYVCAAHPVFSGPAIERLANAPIKECIVTNTIPLDMSKMPPNIKQLSVAPLLGQAISRIHDDESVSSLFGFEKDIQVS